MSDLTSTRLRTSDDIWWTSEVFQSSMNLIECWLKNLSRVFDPVSWDFEDQSQVIRVQEETVTPRFCAISIDAIASTALPKIWDMRWTQSRRQGANQRMPLIAKVCTNLMPPQKKHIVSYCHIVSKIKLQTAHCPGSKNIELRTYCKTK